MIQTSGVFVDVTVTSSSISSSGPYLAYADASTDLFLIDVDYVDASRNNICLCRRQWKDR